MTRYETQRTYLCWLAQNRFHRRYAISRALELEGRGQGRWAGIADAVKRAALGVAA